MAPRDSGDFIFVFSGVRISPIINSAGRGGIGNAVR